jgi:hypothetical protein
MPSSAEAVVWKNMQQRSEADRDFEHGLFDTWDNPAVGAYSLFI